MIYLELLWSFFQIGLFSIGGGYAAMPLIQHQVVELHPWLTMTQFADITAKGVDKGKGLMAVISDQNLRIEETMAFGDGGNDMAIIRRAGIGVAMGNAGDTLKAAADYVTDTVDGDGISKALQKFIL